MDKLRTMATSVVRRAARSWPVMSLPGRSEATTDASGSERGQGLAEYALILAGIAIVAITSLVFLGGTINGLFLAPISSEFGRILSDILGIG